MMNGMAESALHDGLLPLEVSVDETMIRVKFNSGLELATPVARFPRLACAVPKQLEAWRVIGQGDGIRWPDVDEDISLRGLFFGRSPSPTSAIEQVPSLISDLYRITRRLNAIFKDRRPFTPDGHLVGSIGEVVAEYVYDLNLEACSTARFDARTSDGRSVQIKLTGDGGRSYGLRWSSKDKGEHPELLICLRLSTDGFEEVYNGVFPLQLLSGKKDQSNGQVSLAVNHLRKLNVSLLPHQRSFSSINRWFAPRMTHVA